MHLRHAQHPETDTPDSNAADPQVAADMAGLVQRLAGLSLTERAAEILPGVADRLHQDGAHPEMDNLLAPLMPEWVAKQPDQYYTNRETVQNSHCEAFQALVLARLLAPNEQTDNRQGTTTMYFVTADGRAALDRGDVADVLARRLPD